MENRIIGTYGTYRGAEFQIEGGLTFGRDISECNVVIPDNAMLSEKHCRVQELGGRVYLTDLGSVNGTFLSNGSRLTPQQPVELHPGDIFYLADNREQFQLKGDPLMTYSAAKPPGRAKSLPQLDAKKKKFLLIGCIIAAVVILIIALAAGNKRNSIVGTWVLKGGDLKNAFKQLNGSVGTELNFELEFKDDGQLVIRTGTENKRGETIVEYKTDDSYITLTDENGFKEKWEYKIDEDELELIWDDVKGEFERK